MVIEIPLLSKGVQVLAQPTENLDPVVLRICYEYVSIFVEGYPSWLLKLSLFAPLSTKGSQVIPIAGIDLNPVVGQLCHSDFVTVIHCQSARRIKLSDGGTFFPKG